MAFGNLHINLETIKSNIKKIQSNLKNESKILLSAKANAYGLGIIEVCKHLDDTIDFIGVASISEALEIRNANIQTPILLLSEPKHNDLPIVSANNISITVYEKDTIKALSIYSQKNTTQIKTHFKIDTGMTRLGAFWKTSQSTINDWLSLPTSIIKEGFYTHFANSDVNKHPLNTEQIKRFQTLTQTLPDQEILKHCANSGALENIENSEYNLIRVGLKAYDNSFSLTAPIHAIKTIPKNTPVGYGSEYISKSTINVAIIGMGYADGLSSQLSKGGYVLINNHRCNIIGRICMDMFMVEIPNGVKIDLSKEAIIIDSNNSNAMSIYEVAKITDTNPREVMTGLSNRVTRHWYTR